MNIAILKQSLCIDAAVFGDVKTAQEFFSMGIWPDADAVAELPDGYGIGDSYTGGEWAKAVQPDPGPGSEPEPDYMAFLAGLMEGYIENDGT